MSATLEHRLHSIRRRLWQSLVTYGVSWTTVAVVSLVLAVCLADWLFHLDDGGVRLILLLAVLGAGGFIAWRRLLAPLSLRLSDVDLALRVEDRFPGFRDRLSSSVQFLEAAAHPRLGSPGLQKAVVRETLSRLEGIDTDDVVQTRAARRAAMAALAVCLAALVVAALDRTQTAIALQRLAFPFSGPAWPRQTHLRLLDGKLQPLELDHNPLQTVRGEPLKLYAENRSGRLPAKVLLEYRTSDGKVSAEAMRPLSINDAAHQPRELALGQLATSHGEIDFRVIGGDDATPWRRLQVVPPPAVQSLHVSLTPPAYTHRPAERLPEGSGHVQALVGTRVDIAATVNKPLRRAQLRVKDREPLAVGVSDSGVELESSFVIVEPGVYTWRLELIDEQGFENGDPPRYEIRGIADAEPDVRIDVPAADLLITADAEVPVRIVAKDDLGLRDLRLIFERDDRGGDGPEPSPAPREASVLLLGGPERPPEHTAEYLWKIAELQLSPGARVVFRGEATDEFDLTHELAAGTAPPPHVGRSVSRTLSVVSKADKLHELARQQAGLLAELERSFKLQQQSRTQVDDLRSQLRNTGRLRPEDLDALQRTEMGQREVAAQLVHPVQGAKQQAGRLLEELRANHIDDAATERRLSDIASELERLGADHLPLIEQQLTQARKLTQADSSQARPGEEQAGPAAARALEQVADNQWEVLDSLSDLLQDLAQWRNEQDAARELSELVRDQTELNQKTAALGSQTLTKSREGLSPQERADLDKLSAGQKRQAEQLDQLQTRLQGRLEAQGRENPAAMAALDEVLEQARQEGISETMRDAAGQIGENRMGEATRAQSDVLEKLRDLEKTLTSTRDRDSETLVKQLQQAERELERLRQGQEDVLQKMQTAGRIANPSERQAELERLRKDQQQLRDETARLARRLQRLQALKPSASAQRAAQRMQQAQDQTDIDEADRSAESRQEALDDLEQAQRELARDRRRAEERLAREQLEKIADRLQAMVVRQEAVIEETRRLEDLKRQAGRFTRSQLASLRDLATTERALKEETDGLAEKLTAAAVFELALRGAARHLQQATDLLADRRTGAEALAAERAGRRRFVELLEALAHDDNQSRQPQRGEAPQQGNGGENAGPPSEGIPAMAQLKMLLSLQRDLLERTSQLDALRDSTGGLPREQAAELETLAREQTELGDLARNLSQVASEPDDEPDETDADAGGPQQDR